MNYSPWDQLPDRSPIGAEYPVDHFYNKTAKHLIKDTVRIMDNGLALCLDRVGELETTIGELLSDVNKQIDENSTVSQYMAYRYKKEIAAYQEEKQSKMRSKDYYLKPFKYNDMNHRSYFMLFYGEFKGYAQPEEKLPTGVPKWTAALVKKYAKTNNVLKKLLAGELPPDNKFCVQAMDKLAQDKTDLYNDKYVKLVQNPDLPKPVFNPGSAQQKQHIFSWLGIKSEVQSKKTGNCSWDRDQITAVHKMTVDPDVKSFTAALIDYSAAAIIRSTFIPAFYRYSVDGRLHGTYNLLGAKSARYTSQMP